MRLIADRQFKDTNSTVCDTCQTSATSIRSLHKMTSKEVKRYLIGRRNTYAIQRKQQYIVLTYKKDGFWCISLETGNKWRCKDFDGTWEPCNRAGEILEKDETAIARLIVERQLAYAESTVCDTCNSQYIKCFECKNYLEFT